MNKYIDKIMYELKNSSKHGSVSTRDIKSTFKMTKRTKRIYRLMNKLKNVFKIGTMSIRDIKSTSNVIRKASYIRYKIVFLAICSLLIFLCNLVLYMLISVIANLYYELCNLGVDNDTWISFVGSILGGLFTMLGVVLTVRYERRRDEKNRLQHAMPILVLKISKDNDDKSSQYSHIIINVRDFSIENIGHNIAFNITVLVKSLPLHIYDFANIEKLCPGNIEKLRLTLMINEDKIMGELLDRNEALSGYDEVYLRSRLGKESDLVQKKASFIGKMNLRFRDIYNNIYEQEFDSKLYLVKIYEEYYVYIENDSQSKSLPYTLQYNS